MSRPSVIGIYESRFAKSDKTDAILVVCGQKLHVNKALLSCHSDYFNALFNSNFKEKSMEEIEIKDVNFLDFVIVLSFIHPNPLKPSELNDFWSLAERLLELADRFLLPGAKRHWELFLLSTNINRLEKLRIADKYKLDDLFDHALMQYKAHTEFNGLRTNKTFVELSGDSKAKILIRMMVLLNFT